MATVAILVLLLATSSWIGGFIAIAIVARDVLDAPHGSPARHQQT